MTIDPVTRFRQRPDGEILPSEWGDLVRYEDYERLEKRCFPSKVVLIKGAGHYVSEAVYDEIERLRGVLKQIADIGNDPDNQPPAYENTLAKKALGVTVEPAACPPYDKKLNDSLEAIGKVLQEELASEGFGNRGLANCMGMAERIWRAVNPRIAVEPAAARSPDGYAYRYPSIGGSVIVFDGGGLHNGSKPIEAIPYYFGSPVETSACSCYLECKGVAKLEPGEHCSERGPESPAETLELHPDDLAVDRFAAAMKAKLAKKRGEGRGGWDDPSRCTIGFLEKLLVEHVEKGDFTDVGNFAMMIWNRFNHCPPESPAETTAAPLQKAILDQGQWKCAQCKNMVSAWAHRCESCGADRPAETPAALPIDWKSAYEEVLRQRDALQADANRYRWLRNSVFVEGYWIDGVGGVDTKKRVEGMGDYLDQVIDMERIKDAPGHKPESETGSASLNRPLEEFLDDPFEDGK